MKGRFYVIFCSDVKLTIELLEGEIYLKDLMDLIDRQTRHKKFDKSYNVITDVRKAHLNISAAEMDQLIRFIAEKGLINLKKKVALLTKDPNHVVASTLFSLNMKDSDAPHIINIFSTVDAVMDWLHLPWSPEDYTDIVLDPLASGYDLISSK